MTKQLDALIALRGAGEELWDQLDLSQRRLVATHRVLVAGAAVNHVEQHPRQLSPRQTPQRGDAVAFARELVRRHAAQRR